MFDYRQYVESAIARRDYLLSDMEDRINKLWIDGKLSSADRDSLMVLAAESANEALQIDVVEKLASLERRVFELEHPTDQYAIWQAGYQTQRHEIVRFDVTGDGEYDLCQYNGGRSYTALSIGKIEGWNMLDRELFITHTITRDADGGYVLTPVETEPTTEAEGE